MQELDLHLFVFMPIIYFVYGMSFFMLGATIVIEHLTPRRAIHGIKDFLFSSVGFLALFGIMHGVYAFIGMFSILYGGLSLPLNLIRLLLLSVSFYFLCKFGMSFKNWVGAGSMENGARCESAAAAGKGREKSGVSWLGVPEMLFGVWFILSAFFFTYGSGEQWLAAAEALSRYFIGFPGAVIASFSLLTSKKKSSGVSARYRIMASLVFFLFAIIVPISPKAGFFPASLLNVDNFYRATHLPVQVFRSLFAMLITFSLFRFFRLSKKFYSVRFKAVVHVVIAAAIPAVIIISLGCSLIANLFLKSSFSESEKIATLTAEKVSSFFENAAEKVGHHVLFSRLTSIDPITDIFVSLVRENPWINGIVFFDRNNVEMLRIEQYPPSSQVRSKVDADSIRLRKFLSDFTFNTQYEHRDYLLAGHDDHNVTMVIPMTNGSIAVFLSTEELYKSAFSDVMARKGWQLILADHKGEIVMPTHFKRADQVGLFVCRESKKDGYGAAFVVNGIYYHVVEHRIPLNGLSIVMGIPRNEIVAPVFRVYKVFLLGVLAVYLFGLAMALLFVERVTKPLRLIMQRIESIGMGDLEQRPLVTTGDEIQILSEEVERMAGLLAEKKKMEHEMIIMERVASLSRLASGVAHEVNNPLGIISLYCQALLREVDVSDKFYNDLKIIEKHTFRCKKIVEELLIFSRATRKVNVTVDVCGKIREALESALHNRTDLKIEIILEPFPVPPVVKGDPDRLHQLFLNLIMNAFDAMEKEGGSLFISTRTFESDSDKMCEIIFRDTGCGIREEDIGRVFDPFFTTQKPGKGTGLGLYISYIIAHEHNGRIWVESSVGKGAAFHVVFPLSLEANSENQADVSPSRKELEKFPDKG